MPYPTHIAVPFIPAAVPLLERIYEWLTEEQITSVPVVWDDGTQGVAPLTPDVVREGRIAHIALDIQRAADRLDSQQDHIDQRTADRDALIAERAV